MSIPVTGGGASNEDWRTRKVEESERTRWPAVEAEPGGPEKLPSPDTDRARTRKAPNISHSFKAHRQKTGGDKSAPPPPARVCFLSKLESSNSKDSTTLVVPLSQFIARVSQFLNSMRLTDMISADHAFLSNYLSKMKTKVAVFQDRCLDSRLCYTLYFILQNHT